MSRENSVMAAAHCDRAEALASRGLYRRALTELTAAVMCSSALQISGIVERRNALSRHVRCVHRASGDPEW